MTRFAKRLAKLNEATSPAPAKASAPSVDASRVAARLAHLQKAQALARQGRGALPYLPPPPSSAALLSSSPVVSAASVASMATPPRARSGKPSHLPAGFSAQATAYGPCWLRRERLPLRTVHGERQLALPVPAELLGLGAGPEQLLFFDVESTGLAGGTGTVAFLIGMAYLEGTDWVLDQLFLPELGQEAPLLSYLAERLQRHPVLVSYNGKSFDWPLLRTRYLLQQLAVPELAAHVDLLHLCRRLGRGLPNYRLGEVERHWLGFLRQDDLPSAAVPERYLAYLRGAAVALEPVFTHHRHDILSLIALYALLASAGDAQALVPGVLRAGALTACYRRRDFEAAEVLYRDCALDKGKAALDAHGHLVGAALARRRGESALELTRLQTALARAESPARAAQVQLALAKCCEHRLRDPSYALQHARLAAGAESSPLAARRLERLTRRLAASVR